MSYREFHMCLIEFLIGTVVFCVIAAAAIVLYTILGMNDLLWVFWVIVIVIGVIAVLDKASR